MSFFYSDNPVRDAERYAAEQDRWIESCPICAKCGSRICDERLWNVYGELYHVDCAEELFSEETEDHMS